MRSEIKTFLWSTLSPTLRHCSHSMFLGSTCLTTTLIVASLYPRPSLPRLLFPLRVLVHSNGLYDLLSCLSCVHSLWIKSSLKASVFFFFFFFLSFFFLATAKFLESMFSFFFCPLLITSEPRPETIT